MTRARPFPTSRSSTAHAAFVERAVGIVRARGRLPLGWQEIARAQIGPDEIVQYWIDSRDMADMMDNDALKAMVPADILPVIVENLTKAEHDVPRALQAGAARGHRLERLRRAPRPPGGAVESPDVELVPGGCRGLAEGAVTAR